MRWTSTTCPVSDREAWRAALRARCPRMAAVARLDPRAVNEAIEAAAHYGLTEIGPVPVTARQLDGLLRAAMRPWIPGPETPDAAHTFLDAVARAGFLLAGEAIPPDGMAWDLDLAAVFRTDRCPIDLAIYRALGVLVRGAVAATSPGLRPRIRLHGVPDLLRRIPASPRTRFRDRCAACRAMSLRFAHAARPEGPEAEVVFAELLP